MRPSLKSINLSKLNTRSGRRRSHQLWSRLKSPDQGWFLDPECLMVFPEMTSHCSCWWTCWWRNQRVFIISSSRTVTTDTKIFWCVENSRRIYALKSGVPYATGARFTFTRELWNKWEKILADRVFQQSGCPDLHQKHPACKHNP